jgi:predicted unusual protein kinase regulating ubiquinone biosynthesis (AarF/ABC1/UbiB family)/N-methylhydantoinase B/oxoprolinase/acetone carboxylase alpha subunit
MDSANGVLARPKANGPRVAAKEPRFDAEEQALVEQFLTTNAGFVGPDPAIMYDHKMGPRSAREERIFERPIDVHLFQEIRARLTAALDENFEVSEQTVASPAAKFSDLCTAYMTSIGDIAMLSNRGVAGFAIVMHYPVRHILKYFANDPTVGLKPGDAFLVNDARFGGIHNPDQSMVMPHFRDGELVAWTVCAMHEGEVGARAPGGMGPSIESPYEEGFRGSPIKIVENFKLKADLVTLVQNSVREKEVMLVDLRARLATCIRLANQLDAVIDRYGLDAVVGTMRHTLELVADESARRISQMPDGTVRGAFYIDSTSRETAILKINVAMTVSGSKILVDLRGSAPEIQNRSVNCPITASKLGVMVGLMSFFWPDLPKSPAVLQHFDFVSDPKSLVDCSYDVPNAQNVSTGFKVITATEVLMSKLAFSVPEKHAAIKAPWYNQPAGMMYGGETQHGHEVGNICADLNGMAGGARWNRDGEHSICANFAQMNDIGESEDTEENLPVVMFASKKFTPDLVSFGKFRGGAGYQTIYSRYGTSNFGFQAVTNGSKFSSTVGLFGGYGSPCYPITKIKGINIFEELRETPNSYQADVVELLNQRPLKGATYETVAGALEFELAFEGELYVLHQGAAGAYGDVLERDPDLVIKDIREGLLSKRAAREICFVAFDDTTLIVDHDATRRLRDGERRARLARGLKWDDFVSKHVRKAPPVGLLYFGRWNDDREVYGGMYKAMPGEFPREIYLPDPKLIYEAVLNRKVVSGVSTEDAIEYDPLTEELQQPWTLRSIRKFLRVQGYMLRMVGGIAGSGAASLFRRRGSRLPAFQKAIGRHLSDYLISCGPTFMKLGQVLSTRPDLLGENIANELRRLQDNVPPMKAAQARAIVETSLGRRIGDVFAEFSAEAIAAASVAQVHKGRLKDGREVAVKIKRPGLEQEVSDDLRALSTLVGIARTLVPGVSAINPRELITELGLAVRGQMNFRAEVENNRRFAREFAHHDWVRLPEVYDDYSSSDVITMEFINGVSPKAYVARRGAFDADLAAKIYGMYIEMAFTNRFIHADLHSGNIMVEGEGRVVLMDTGLAHEFPSYYVKRHLRAYLCVAAVDGYMQGDNYLGDRPHMASPEAKAAVSHDLHLMYQRWDKNRAKGHTRDLTTLWLQILALLRKHRIALDRELLMMMVADITMSGVVHEFDPEFDVVEYTRQELPRLIFRDGKLALNDPFLLAASRRDLLRDIREAMGIDVNDDEYV